MLDQEGGVKASTVVDTVTRILTNDKALEAATPETKLENIDTTHINRGVNATPLKTSAEPKPSIVPSQEHAVVFKGQKLASLPKPKPVITGQKNAILTGR